jgi:hypothetical protein
MTFFYEVFQVTHITMTSGVVLKMMWLSILVKKRLEEVNLEYLRHGRLIFVRLSL